MLNIGMTELLIFGIIALLVLGPEKLPEAVRVVGKWYGKIKRTVSNIQNDFDRELRLSELREEMQAELKRIQALEAKMQAHMHELQTPMPHQAATQEFTSPESAETAALMQQDPLRPSHYSSLVYIGMAQPLMLCPSLTRTAPTVARHNKAQADLDAERCDMPVASAYSALKVAV